MAKFKIGDKVRIAKPEVTKGTCWVEGMGMEYYIGMTSRIKRIRCENVDLEDFALVFPLSSLILIEEADEQLTEQVTKQIDWEQRRWELATRLYANTSKLSVVDALVQADAFILHYIETQLP